MNVQKMSLLWSKTNILFLSICAYLLILSYANAVPILNNSENEKEFFNIDGGELDAEFDPVTPFSRYQRSPMDRSSMVRFGKRAPMDRSAMVRFGKRAPMDRSSMVRFGKRAPMDRSAMVRFGKRAPMDRSSMMISGQYNVYSEYCRHIANNFIANIVNGLVDNGVLGEPYVSCGPNSIDVRFDTRNTFRGVVFVQNHLNDPDCRSAPITSSHTSNGNGFSGADARNAQIHLNFKSCGFERMRKITSVKGLFISTTLVVAFHPEFLTKFDRIYKLQCFYMEAQAECGKEISVKMPPPLMHTQQVPMPTCRYEVLEGGPEGQPIFFATVGQMVYHKWTCDSQQENQFCMVVHSCTVDDGNGDRVELIDEKGCANDKYLLQNLDYVSDLLVGKEAHVYKYADRPSMFFDCKITLTIKEPNQVYCEVPNCPDPPRRLRRQENITNIFKNDKLDKSSRDDININISHFSTHETSEMDQICYPAVKFAGIGMFNVIAFGASAILFHNTYKLL